MRKPPVCLRRDAKERFAGAAFGKHISAAAKILVENAKEKWYIILRMGFCSERTVEMRVPNKKKQTGETMRMLFLVTQVGLCMVSALAVGGLLGYGADRLLGTLPWITILGLFLGIAAGFRSVWSLIARYTKDPAEEVKPVKDRKLAEAEEEFRRWKQERGKNDREQ